jgi:hypothetical protein
MLGKLNEANEVASLSASVTIEQVLARVDVEAGASVLMQGTESDELGANRGWSPAPVVPLQVREKRNALFQLFQILTHSAYLSSSVRVRSFSSRFQAQMVGERGKISAVSGAGATARRLVESKTWCAKTSATSREPVARR